MKKSVVLAIGGCMLIALQASAWADKAASAAGAWDGAIQIPGITLDVHVDLDRKDDGPWTGDIDIPAQKVKDHPLSSIEVNDSSASFTLSNVPGNPSFEGKMSKDGNKISGDFSQGGQTYPFELSRTATSM